MLKDTLSEDLKSAMRAKDDARLRTIRSLRAALMEKEIAERQGGEAQLSEEQEASVLQKQAKQRRDALEQFRAAGREDLASKEEEELRIIESYLPQQLGDEEVRQTVRRIVAELGPVTPREMGKVMGEAMRQLRGRAEGKRVQDAVQSIIREAGSGS